MSWEEHVRRVDPYIPGEQPKDKDIIKLNTNECPYPPSPAVLEAQKAYPYEAGRLYPDTEATELAESIAGFYHVPADQIFVGVGSDDVLSLAFLTLFNGGGEVLFPDITYSFYDVWASLYRIPYRQIPVDDDFRIHARDYYDAPGGVIIANPNAPTGVLESVDFVEDIVKHNPGTVVIVDEAYIDFGGTSALPLIDRYENLLVVQTCSKSRSLAGMRIGFAFGSKNIIRYLKDARFASNSYPMNGMQISLGAASFRDAAYFHEICGRVVQTRERSKEALRGLGFSFPDSKTNFIFAKHERLTGREIYEQLRNRRIYVRHWQKPRIEDHLRITIGTDDQMDTLFSALREIVETTA
ncbi:MAG: aminotransferase class I/II-fold pyridoxal phosphate-dependent enzyme [Lachnospiraceae bacterium]|nr:aminotransferase class I/II-fold pyridoxal phosphate-dependent enzyme [Lachnospiraceae bacterium]